MDKDRDFGHQFLFWPLTVAPRGVILVPYGVGYLSIPPRSLFSNVLEIWDVFANSVCLCYLWFPAVKKGSNASSKNRVVGLSPFVSTYTRNLFPSVCLSHRPGPALSVLWPLYTFGTSRSGVPVHPSAFTFFELFGNLGCVCK